MKHKAIPVHKKPNGQIPYMGDFYQLETDTIVNKRIPGLGATTSEIKADRDSIIVVPNTPVITGKCQAHKKDNLFGVKAKVKTDDIVNYLYDTFVAKKHVKIMVTPESFWKVKQAFQEIGRSMYSCFLMWDECDKLTKDIDYREAITLPLDDFFQFPQKAMVSATALQSSDPRFAGFIMVEFEPDFDIRKDITIVQTNNVLQCLKDIRIQEQERPLYIFLNKTDMILGLIEKLGLSDDSAVFCSEKSVDKLKGKGFKAAYVDWEPTKAKKYNWLTSRFFTAVDIVLDEKPDILIISDPFLSDFTLMDPHTDVIQAIGRFRNGTADIVQIVNTKSDYPIRTAEGINEYFKAAWYAYKTVRCLYEASTSEEIRRAYKEALDQLSFNGMITDGRPDYFKMDNYRDEELVKTSYHDIDRLLAAYNEADAFNVTVVNPPYFYKIGEHERLKLESPTVSMKEKRKQIVEILDSLAEDDDTPLKMDYLAQLRDVDPLIVDAYNKIGKEGIESCKYSAKKMKEAIILADFETRKNGTELLELIRNSFQVGNKYTLSYIKNELIRLYGLLHITPPDHDKITAQTIKTYFEVAETQVKDKKTNKKVRAFTILKSKI